MRPPRRSGLVALVGLALLVAACGVPTEETADRANPDDVPFSLLAPAAGNATIVPAVPGRTVSAYLYDAKAERLLPVNVLAEDLSLDEVLQILDRDSDELGFGSGLQNPLAEASVIEGVEVDRGVAEISLAEAFTEMTGTNQVVAIAQLVFTATARPGVGQVTFRVDGKPVEVPRGDGSVTESAVTRADYVRLAPVG